MSVEEFKGKKMEELVRYFFKKDGHIEWRKLAEGRNEIIGTINGLKVVIGKDGVIKEIYGD